MSSHDLITYLRQHSARYVPTPLSNCQAVYVNGWFRIRGYSEHGSCQNSERFLELSADASQRTTKVLPIVHKHVIRQQPQALGHGQIAAQLFVLRWTKPEVESSTVFLISHAQNNEEAAVLPTQYLRHLYPDQSSFQAEWPTDQKDPPVLKPFMVTLVHLDHFFENIYLHGLQRSDSPIVNPTYHGCYHEWKPALRPFFHLLPDGERYSLLIVLMRLYNGLRSLTPPTTLRLLQSPSYCARFVLGEAQIEVRLGIWERVTANQVSIYLSELLDPEEETWSFLYATSAMKNEAACLPREVLPDQFWHKRGQSVQRTVSPQTRDASQKTNRFGHEPRHRICLASALWDIYSFKTADMEVMANAVRWVIDEHRRNSKSSHEQPLDGNHKAPCQLDACVD